jgi:catechol 2,3-dioxygenase-like lactoylglutathione lyase family enzyme
MRMTSSLAGARLQTLVWSADIARSEYFYSELLGLVLQGRSHGALVYKVGEGVLRVSPVPSTSASEHTIFGFEVADLSPVAKQLSNAGIATERFPGFEHDEDGIWTAPDSTGVLWFRDPDGNLISAVRYA